MRITQDQPAGKQIADVAAHLCFEIGRRNCVVIGTVKGVSSVNRVRQRPVIGLRRRQQHDTFLQITFGAGLFNKTQQVALRGQTIAVPRLAWPTLHNFIGITKTGAGRGSG